MENKYIPKFDDENMELLLLENIEDAFDCANFASKHNMDVKFTKTDNVSSLDVVATFQMKGFRHELIISDECGLFVLFKKTTEQESVEYMEWKSLLKAVGIDFSIVKEGTNLNIALMIDEERLQTVSHSKAGRPVGHDFDYEKIKQMQSEGKTNKEIYTELGMSKALFYLRMREYNQ